eukprot:m.1455026 g.1455026  ORF g.1455026 m.1455026 type:complete len:426 (+) comp25119_c0_seq39:3429-4706(+)
MALLMSVARTTLTGAVFEALLSEYLRTVAALDDTTPTDRTRFESLRTLLVGHFVVAMLDEHSDVLVAEVARGVRVIKLFLDTGHSVPESLALLLALLQAHEHVCKSDAELLQQLLPSLEGLKCHEDTFIASQAEDISIAIATRSLHWIKREASSGATDSDSSPLGEILTDLQDKLLPVRTHAIVQLQKMVHRKDPAITKDLAFILGLFEAQLAHSDSYMYLTAINGLVAMGNTYPGKTIPILVRKFRRVSPALKVETRLKFAEALMKIAKTFGTEVLPKYRHFFVAPMLDATQDPDPHIRASCFSNLATLAELLRYSLHGYLEDLLASTRDALQVDKSAPVRRAAAFVLASLLRGTSDNAFDVLGGATLKTTMQLLRTIEARDPDDVTKYHVRAALSTLDDIVSKFMNPGRKSPAAVFLPSHFQG